MHKSRLGSIGIDCREGELEAHARFWAEALGYSVKPRSPEDGDKYIQLEGPAREPQFFLQQVEHEPRVHLDIETDDIEAEVRRLERLGATIVARMRAWVVMQAPSGQRFCVVRPQRPDFEQHAVEREA